MINSGSKNFPDFSFLLLKRLAMLLKNFPKNNFLIVFVVLFLMLAIQYYWISHDNSVQGGDTGEHLLISLEFFRGFSGIISDNGLPIVKKLLKLSYLFSDTTQHSNLYWPNANNFIAALFCSIFGISLFSVKAVMLLYLAILLLSVYFLGRHLSGHGCGLVAMILVFLFPVIFESFRQYQLDSSLTALVALTILFLLKSDSFGKTYYSLSAGLVFGWALLIKGQAVFFLIGPLFYVVYKTLFSSPKNNFKQRIYNAVIFAVVVVLTATVWWGPRAAAAAEALLAQYCGNQIAVLSDFSQKYSADSIVFYLKAIVDSCGIIFCSFFVISFIFFLRSNIKDKVFYILWVLVPLVIFTFVFQVKQARYIMPILPAVSLMTAWALVRVRSYILRCWIIGILFLWGILQFTVLSFCSWLEQPRIFFYKTHLFPRTDYETIKPIVQNYRMKEVAEIIKDNATYRDQDIKVGIIAPLNTQPFYMMYLMNYYDENLIPTSLIKLPHQFFSYFYEFEFLVFSMRSDVSIEWPSGEAFMGLFERYHAGALKQNESFSSSRRSWWFQSLWYLDRHRKDFELIAKVPYEASYEFENEKFVYYIYKRIYKLRLIDRVTDSRLDIYDIRHL